MSMRPALALKVAEVAQDLEDQGVADRGMAEDNGAEDDAFSYRSRQIIQSLVRAFCLAAGVQEKSSVLSE